MNASPTDTLGRRSEPLRAAKRSSILSVGSKHDRLSDSGDLRAPRPEDGPLGVDNSAIFGDEVSPAKGARESGVDMPEVLRALSESQQTLQVGPGGPWRTDRGGLGLPLAAGLRLCAAH
mmetsp:Transcript_27033/g.68019  ORF Transcript_27033/g.68019 Transcript_27033/m.68019 type:complete len:119 (+) Transcript_27033:346-702(+)